MKYPELLMRKIQRTSRKIAELSATEDRENEWWGHDTNLGDLCFSIQRELSKFYDWIKENEKKT